jgi:hypothetical protein
MTLYEIVRQTLEENGGSCSRGELLNAILRNSATAQRFPKSRGFAALLSNMRHSGFIEVDGDVVHRTKRRLGHRHL